MDRNKYFAIRNDDGDWWENLNGWTEFLESATIFTEAQKNSLTLPIGGRWIELECEL